MSQNAEVPVDEDEVLSQHTQTNEDRFHALEQHIIYLTQQVQQNQQPQIQPPPTPPPPPPTQPNLKPPYSSLPLGHPL